MKNASFYQHGAAHVFYGCTIPYENSYKKLKENELQENNCLLRSSHLV